MRGREGEREGWKGGRKVLTRSMRSERFFSICCGGSLLIKSSAQSSCWSCLDWRGDRGERKRGEGEKGEGERGEGRRGERRGEKGEGERGEGRGESGEEERKGTEGERCRSKAVHFSVRTNCSSPHTAIAIHILPHNLWAEL